MEASCRKRTSSWCSPLTAGHPLRFVDIAKPRRLFSLSWTPRRPCEAPDVVPDKPRNPMLCPRRRPLRPPSSTSKTTLPCIPSCPDHTYVLRVSSRFFPLLPSPFASSDDHRASAAALLRHELDAGELRLPPRPQALPMEGRRRPSESQDLACGWRRGLASFRESDGEGVGGYRGFFL